VISFLFSLSAVTALYAPAGLAAALAGWPWAGERPSPVGIALTAGLWLGVLLTRPFPLLPVIGPIGWLPFAVLAGLLAGLAAERPRWRLAGSAALLALAVAVTIIIGEAVYNPAFQPPAWMAYSGMAAMGVLSLARLATVAEETYTPALLALASLALAAIAWLYGTRLSLHALTLAGAIIGAGLAARAAGLAWPRSASFAAGAGHLTIAAAMMFGDPQFVIPAGITLLIPFAPSIAAVLHRADERQAARNVIAVAAILAAAGPAMFLIGF